MPETRSLLDSNVAGAAHGDWPAWAVEMTGWAAAILLAAAVPLLLWLR